jgi:hypothetical protein
MAQAKNQSLIPVEQIEPRILLIRGQRVVLDADLAELYGTTTKALNQAVKRNAGRFPADFRFQLNIAEKTEVVTNCDHLSRLKFTKNLPNAFTEHGALMAASMLSTPRAIDVSVYVIRAFVRLRELLSTHKELSRKFADLERRVSSHDEAIQSLVAAIRRLMQPPPSASPSASPRRIGFHVKQEKKP